MSIDCWFLFVLDLLLMVSLCVDFALPFLFMFDKVGLSIVDVFVIVVIFIGLEFSFQYFL